MKISCSHGQGFTLIEISVLGLILLIAVSAIFLLTNRGLTDSRSLIPLFPSPTLVANLTSPPTLHPTFDVSELSGNYQLIPKICLQDLQSEDCKTQFKALLDTQCGGKLRNPGCEAIRQEIFGYASERVCQAKPDSGACKCLQTEDFQSQACQDAVQELINKIIEGVCQSDPTSQVCQCLQNRDFQSQDCKDAYFNFLMDILKKRCQENADLPACKCVDAAYPKLCLLSIKR